jgi:hypothetical protein
MTEVVMDRGAGGGGGVFPPPPQAARMTVNIKASIDSARTRNDLIASPVDVKLVCSGNSSVEE